MIPEPQPQPIEEPNQPAPIDAASDEEFIPDSSIDLFSDDHDEQGNGADESL